MNQSRRNGLLIAAGVVVVLAAIYFGVGAWRSAHSSIPAGAYSGVATLDPALYKGPAHDAYRVAREHPELLAQLHCYCGCDRVRGHTSLLDCFRDSHGGHCAICIGEAVDAERMYKAGNPVEQIRDTLRGLYDHHES
jgi:uncharacterized protein with PCYCGC motif